jgi:hypothetical protein
MKPWDRKFLPADIGKARADWPDTGAVGTIQLDGRKDRCAATGRRFVGEAFVRRRLALKPLSAGVQAVYFGSLLLGHLHDNDPGAMRPAVYLRRKAPAIKSKV